MLENFMLSHFADVVVSFLEKDIDKEISINVVGDVMFDEYYNVEVERISPEFPIPIYKSLNSDPDAGIVPGGAANVAYQFSHFNVKSELVALLSKIGEVVFNAKGINTERCKIIENICLPVKKRYYSQNIPLVRHDIEKTNYGLDDIKKYLIDLEIDDSDFTIYSDYSKGLFCCPWFRKYMQKTRNIVDPKSNYIDLWEGCSYFKPNAIEAEKLSERKNVYNQVDFFIDALKCDGVLVTQAGSGVVGKENDGDFFDVRPDILLPPAECVIGAGDCFISFVAMALARGFSLEQSAQIAFVAGCAYVQKRQSSPLSPADILEYVGVKQLKKPELLARRNFDLVFTNGCFDFGLTGAHVECLKFAKSRGQKLVVGINSDASVAKLKGLDRPVLPLAERVNILQSLSFVDYVVPFEEDTPYEIIKKIKPDLIVKGGDYKVHEVVGNDLCDVEIFNMIQSISTTEKIKKLNEIMKSANSKKQN